MNEDINVREKLKILGLSIKEEKVFLALVDGLGTPLEISRATKVARAAVYEIFKKLKKRGLVETKISGGKKSWHLLNNKELTNVLYETKKVLLGFNDGREETLGTTDGVIVVHRGSEAIKKAVFGMITNRKNDRFLALTPFSDILDKGWLSIFTPDEINEFNRLVKKNSIISELVAPEHWIEDHYKAMGEAWAKDYEGRSSSAVYLTSKYFNHSAQIFAFKDSMYLLALNDKMIIEIRHSDIQKMILAMYSFMKDRGEVVDVNKRLRDLMEKS
jgi:sugar-specific transcriptional regulator TrmB